MSVDSMQVYRGMDIGTAKPGAAIRDRISYEMIDMTDPDTDFTVSEFQSKGRAVLETIRDRGAVALIAGGSGLHFRSLIDPLTFEPTDPDLKGDLESVEAADLVSQLIAVDPEAGDVVDLQNPRRVLRAVEVHRLTGEDPKLSRFG